MAVNDRDLFAQADQQVTARITGQPDAIESAKQRNHPTAAAEAAQRASEQTLRVFGGRCWTCDDRTAHGDPTAWLGI